MDIKINKPTQEELDQADEEAEAMALNAKALSDELFEVVRAHKPEPLVAGMALASLIAYLARGVTPQPDGAEIWLQYLDETTAEIFDELDKVETLQ